MRGSFVLGVIGGIFGFFAAVADILLGGLGQALQSGGVSVSSSDISTLYGGGVAAMIGSVLAIAGGAMGKKKGGVAMLIGGIMIVVGTSVFGLLPFILLMVGGILAVREKPDLVMMQPMQQNPMVSQTQPASTTGGASTGQRFCTNCGKSIGQDVKFCGKCGSPV